jgi:hypothetical protein
MSPNYGGQPDGDNCEEERVMNLDDVHTWRTMNLVDEDGEKIGTIEGIYLDRHTGEPAWASVITGLISPKYTFVPIGDAEVVGDDTVKISLPKEKVKHAPRMDPDGELSPDEERALWDYYGRSDYDEWQGEDRTRGMGLHDEEEDRAREEERRAGARDDDDADAGAIVGVRLRRVVVAVPAGGGGPAQGV